LLANRNRIVRCSRCHGLNHNKTSCTADISAIQRDNAISTSRNSTGKRKASSGIRRNQTSQQPRLEIDNDSDDAASDNESEGTNFEAEEVAEPIEPVENSEYVWVNCPIVNEEMTNTRSSSHSKSIIPQNSIRKRPGAINIPKEAVSELDFFNLLWSDEVDDMFVENTQNYGISTEPRTWTTFSQLELRKYLAICLWFAVINVRNNEYVWEEPVFQNSFVTNLMDQQRFMAIRRCVHCVNVVGISDEERRMMNVDDCFWIVDPFLKIIAENFQNYWLLDVNVNIDEGTIGFRGHHRARCFNPNKPHKYHFKAFCLNDSATSYLYNFYMYRGKDEAADPELPATAAPVKRLMQSLSGSKVYHVVYLDNWYTSMECVKWLVQNKFGCVGTIKANRKNTPKDFMVKGTDKSGDPRGTMKQAVCEVEGEEVFFGSWKDKKAVHMLSTLASHIETCFRRCKENGKWTKKEFPIPSVIKLYNKSMGGTDLFDYRLALYRVPLVAKKWACRIFDHFFMSVVLNAFILMKSARKLPDGYIYRTFVVNLMQQLVQEELQPPVNNNSSCRKHTSTILTNSGPFVGFHSPRKMPDIGTQRQRCKCRICKSRVNIMCETCGVYLCIKSAPNEPTCFTKFHTRNSG
jgi:hypothetical protein